MFGREEEAREYSVYCEEEGGKRKGISLKRVREGAGKKYGGGEVVEGGGGGRRK